jgi:predicted DNA-binding ribbon-helix-helix protein
MLPNKKWARGGALMPKQTSVPRGKSLVVKRSIRVGAHNTSIGLEAAFWTALKGIAAAQGIPISHLIAKIDNKRRKDRLSNLSSVIRLFVLDYYRRRP